jgi:hypothetical protein
VAISFLLPFAFALQSLSAAISLAAVQVELVMTVELLSALSMAGLTVLVAAVAVEREGPAGASVGFGDLLVFCFELFICTHRSGLSL